MSSRFFFFFILLNKKKNKRRKHVLSNDTKQKAKKSFLLFAICFVVFFGSKHISLLSWYFSLTFITVSFLLSDNSKGLFYKRCVIQDMAKMTLEFSEQNHWMQHSVIPSILNKNNSYSFDNMWIYCFKLWYFYVFVFRYKNRCETK